MLRRLVLIILLLTFALPAAATDCVEVDATGAGGSPEMRVDLVGNYLWIQYGHAEQADSWADDIVSVDYTGAVGATVCDDGTVTVHYPQPASEFAAPTPDVTHDLRDLYPGILDAVLNIVWPFA